MAIAIDQANAGTADNDADGTSISVNTAAAVASGGFIVASVAWWHASATLSSVSGGGLTWNIAVQGKHPTNNAQSAIAYAQAPSGLASGTTITANYSTTVNARGIGITSFTGVATSSPVDVTAMTDGVTGAVTSGARTLLAGSVLVIHDHAQAVGSFTVTGPSIEAFEAGDGANFDTVTCYQIATSAGSYTVAGTWSTTPEHVTAVAAFKEAAGSSDATVTAVPAVAAADAPLGSISAGSAVTGVVSDAAADAPAGAATASAGTDDFETRSNGTLSAPWLAWYSASMPTITGGVAYAGVAAGSSANATYAVATDSADAVTEGVFETALTPGNVESFMVAARLTAHSSSANGYFFQLSDEAPAGTGTTIRPRLYAGSGFSVLATGSNIASSAIDAMRIEVIGDQITGYARISSVWTSVVSATDSTYTAAGYAGFSVRQPTGAAPDNGFEEVSWGTASGTDATVTAVPAVAAADAPAGVLSAGSSVTGVAATALADAPPANQIISSVVNAPAVVALADAPAGAPTAGGDATVVAVPAVAAADAPAGVVSADAEVTGVPSDAAADAPAGVLSAGATVAGVAAGATADAPRAGISPDPGGDDGAGSVAVVFAEGVQ